MSVLPSPSKSPRKRVEFDCGLSNRATQFREASIVTTPSLQSASPLHPAKIESDAGVAVSVNTCPCVNAVEHVSPHRIPPGLLVTVPLPVPDLTTVSWGGVTENVMVLLIPRFVDTAMSRVPTLALESI